MSKYERKTRDTYEIWTNYGYGWECECVEDNYKDLKVNLKAYRDNTNATIKWKKKRVAI